MEYKESTLTKKDYMKASLRSYFLQNGFNYNSYQGTGYAFIIYPALKKIYKNEPDELKEALGGNIEFYNTNPHMVPFITSLQLAMLDHGEDVDDARSIKMALMGPMAGIGDSIAQFGLAPLFSTVCAGLAMEGLILGPILFLVAMIGGMLAIKVAMGYIGFKLGTSVIDTLSKQIAKISEAANIIGVTVISGLAVNFVKANIALEYTTTLETGENQVIAFQTILDQILPNLLPALITILVYILIKKYNWSTYKLIGLLLVAGIALSALGILG
ncbi:PTS system mannose/fructose/sorbose family transporter subunit IID [Carnobacterium sp. CS13]|uniref:PTS system mannose/fructose/sorbose family transporter subunit IID n=1 Tax=Carnobacterium sp. CS13 TaxID=2800128 RepID=UPI001913AEBA|nr:PTS system mannose/fructose/sorbose family transporter subunit IID [Carnobacterium sp. CS13]QQP70014.1 PTS system mannose/fructose/sorbose family transporter subunit IID [Carnobacterium sp. CS13]